MELSEQVGVPWRIETSPSGGTIRKAFGLLVASIGIRLSTTGFCSNVSEKALCPEPAHCPAEDSMRGFGVF